MKIGIQELPFFNYYLIRKSDMLPKPLRDYYRTYFYSHAHTPNKQDKCLETRKKIIEFFFPNRVAETQSENQFRRWSYIDQATVDQLLAGDLSYLKINKKELKEINKLKYWDQIEYAKQLKKQGKVKNIILTEDEKNKILKSKNPFNVIKKLARMGKLWSKPAKLINQRDLDELL